MKDFSASLQNIEDRLLLIPEDARDLETLRDELQTIMSLIQDQILERHLSLEEIKSIDKQAGRIKHIAAFFGKLEHISECLLAEAGGEASHILSKGFRGTKIEDGRETMLEWQSLETKQYASQESLNSKLLRQWFLDNLSDPFPDRQTKETLVWKTNALLETASPQKDSKFSLSTQPIDVQQCALWFINSRRRSQWTSLFRQFAQSDKLTMKKLMDHLLEEEDVARPGRNLALESILEVDAKGIRCNQIELSKRVEDCRELFSSLMEWLRQKPKEKVGDWMDEVIEEAKMELKEERKALREERERIAYSDRDNEGGQRQQKRKNSDDDYAELAEESEDRRRSGRIVKRKFAQVDEGRSAGFNYPACETPHSLNSSAYLGDSSGSISSWSSSGSSRRLPSLFESNDSLSRSVSATSSVSSLASYDAFHKVPGSPTLRILKNTQSFIADQSHLQPLQSYEPGQTRMTELTSFQLSHPWPTEAQTSLPITSGTELARPVDIPMQKSTTILFPVGSYHN